MTSRYSPADNLRPRRAAHTIFRPPSPHQAEPIGYGRIHDLELLRIQPADQTYELDVRNGHAALC
jgi:hypothetical protein